MPRPARPQLLQKRLLPLSSPGENITGDFFLPADELLHAAPVYIVVVMKPLADYTLTDCWLSLSGIQSGI